MVFNVSSVILRVLRASVVANVPSILIHTRVPAADAPNTEAVRLLRFQLSLGPVRGRAQRPGMLFDIYKACLEVVRIIYPARAVTTPSANLIVAQMLMCVLLYSTTRRRHQPGTSPPAVGGLRA